MQTGDLVEHLPSKSEHPTLVKIYADWGHKADFRVGIIIDTKDTFSLVMPCRSKDAKPRWYQDTELRIVSAVG